jgi:protein TonB
LSSQLVKVCLLAFLLVLFLAPAPGQSNPAAHDSASITKDSTSVSDDQDFASYQRVTKGITAPKATHAPDPQYPELPPDTEPRGLVVMLVGVDAHGHVGPVRVLRSSAPAFENSALETVKKWKFKPAKQGDKAVPVQITVEMKFEK